MEDRLEFSFLILFTDSTTLPLQISETAAAALNEMAEAYVAKKGTIRLSDATQGVKAELMDMLSLPERGAPWPNKPTACRWVRVAEG
jgi:hypothetical protein